MRPDVWAGRHSRCGRTRTGRHSPSVSQRTDWRQGRRLHSLLLLPASLPPSINHTSLTLHLHYDGCLSPARLIISSSFTSPGSPLFIHSSLPSTVFFLIVQVRLPGLFSLQPSPYFITGIRFGERIPTCRLLEKSKGGRGEEGVLVFRARCPPFAWCVIHI